MRTVVKRVTLWVALVWLLGGLEMVCAEDFDGFGPMPVRNFQPFQLLFIGMPGDRAAVLPAKAFDIRLELAETATIFNEQTDRINAKVKFETLRSGLFLRYGVSNRLEAGIEIPVLSRTRGFLEGTITGVERATTGLNPARGALKDTSFAFRVSRDGQLLMQGGDDHYGLGDITLSSKYQLLTQTDSIPALSVRAAFKVPSGDSARFLGSGHPDFGVGLAAEKRVGERWWLYANANGLFPTGHVSGLAVGPGFSGLMAAEYHWTPAFTVIAQFDAYTSMYRGTGLRLYDKGVTEGVLGFSYLFDRRFLWQVYGVENLDFIRDSAADFTLSTVLTYRFRS
jgi:hypothetical protein